MKRSAMRARPPADHSSEPGYREWKTPVYGACQVCGTRDLLIRHHAITERHVRDHGGDPYDLRNSLLIGCGRRCACHRQHHSALRRLPVEVLAPDVFLFAIELLGADGAAAYLAKYYR